MTSDPSTALPPSGSSTSGYLPNSPDGGASSFVASNYLSSSGNATYSDALPPDRPKRSATGWIIGLAAVIVTVVVIVALVVPRLSGDVFGNPGSGNPTPDMCPAAEEPPSPPPIIGDRAYGGKMSYQLLGAPWSTPVLDDRVPFGPPAYSQTVVDHPNYSGKNSWVSSVLIGELWIGDGFSSTQQGAEVIFRCAIGKFYSDTQVTTTTVSSASHPVDGHDGWLLVSDLSFSIPNLPVTGERAIILVVATDPANQDYSLFYASIPNDQTQLLPDAEAAMDSLRVDG